MGRRLHFVHMTKDYRLKSAVLLFIGNQKVWGNDASYNRSHTPNQKGDIVTATYLAYNKEIIKTKRKYLICYASITFATKNIRLLG